MRPGAAERTHLELHRLDNMKKAIFLPSMTTWLEERLAMACKIKEEYNNIKTAITK